MVIPLRGCDMVLGVQWLFALGEIIWNFGCLTMKFLVKGEPCSTHGIVLGLIAVEDVNHPSKCFVAVGHELGLCTLVMSSPDQVTLTTYLLIYNDKLQGLLKEFFNVFQTLNGLPPPWI